MKEAKNVFTISIFELINLIKDGDLSLELLANESNIQRDDVWNKEKKSLFIDSILNNSSEIPAIILINKDNKFMVADGKQRILSILGYVNDEFKLSKKCGSEYSNLKFSNLPDEERDIILNKELLIHEIPYSSDDQLRNTFIRLNCGEKLKAIEVWRASLGNKLPLIQGIASHDLFSLFYFTTSQLKRFTDTEIALDLLMEELNPGSDHNKRAKEIFVNKEEDFILDNDVLKNNILNKLNYLFTSLNSRPQEYIKIITSSVNKILIYRLVTEAINYNINEDDFYSFLEQYFTNPKNSYVKIAGRTSTSNKSSLVMRYKHLLRSFRKYIKVSQSSEEIA